MDQLSIASASIYFRSKYRLPAPPDRSAGTFKGGYCSYARGIQKSHVSLRWLDNNILASICSWAVWFECHFVGNPDDRFCRLVAHYTKDNRVSKTYFPYFVKTIKLCLSNDVASGSEITSCNTIDKPLVVYRLSGEVMTSITTWHTNWQNYNFFRQKWDFKVILMPNDKWNLTCVLLYYWIY